MRVEWEEPPAADKSETPKGALGEFAAELAANPNQWARWPFPRKDRKAADNLQYRLRHEFGLDTVIRLVGGEHRIYARYVPPPRRRRKP